MDSLVRLTALLVLSLAAATAVPAAADYDGPDGYGTTIANQLDVSHDGYVREGQSSGTYDPTTYVVIEAEDGTTEQVDGDTVIASPLRPRSKHRRPRRPSWSNNPWSVALARSGSTGIGRTAMVTTFGWKDTASWNV
jgi:hypothetical protein